MVHGLPVAARHGSMGREAAGLVVSAVRKSGEQPRSVLFLLLAQYWVPAMGCYCWPCLGTASVNNFKSALRDLPRGWSSGDSPCRVETINHLT